MRLLDWCKYVHWPQLFIQSVLQQMAVCKERKLPVTKQFPPVCLLNLVVLKLVIKIRFVIVRTYEYPLTCTSTYVRKKYVPQAFFTIYAYSVEWGRPVVRTYSYMYKHDLSLRVHFEPWASPGNFLEGHDFQFEKNWANFATFWL